MKNILIIYTGGTIGMMQDAKTNALKAFDFAHITSHVPELDRLNYHLDIHSFNPLMDSSDMDPETWIRIAEEIERNYSKYDGFVVLHGTDTMAFTASALSFMFENLGKPVILTGSQLPIGEIRTDAKENLITALEIAAAYDEDGAIVPEVCIYFDYQLMRGNRSTKYDASSFEAFRSPNYPSLAQAGVHLEFNKEVITKKQSGKFKVAKKMETAIGVLKIFPGINEEYVQSILGNPSLKAVILEGFGAGNTNTKTWFLLALKKAISDGKIVLDISQCVSGSVELGRYETSRALVDMGVISGYDMSFEAAIAKLMYLLANAENKKEIISKLSESLRGELRKK